MYNMSEAEWDDPNFTFPAEVVDPVLINNYPVDRMGEVSRFSELEFNQAELTLGGTYAFSPALYTTTELSYSLFEDEDPYVYGDQDGEAYQAYVAVGYRF